MTSRFRAGRRILHPRRAWPLLAGGLLLTALLLRAAAFHPAALAQSPEAVSLQEYTGRVARALSLAQQAADTSDLAARRALLDQAAAQVRDIHFVEAEGERISVENGTLIDALQDPTRVPRAVQRLQALRGELSRPTSRADLAALARLRSILNNPPFGDTASNNWLVRLLQELQLWVSRLLGSTVRGIYDARDLLTILGLILVGVVLLYFVRNLRGNVAAELAAPDGEVVGPNPDSGSAFRQAQALAGAGDYRAAVRQLCLATLLLLDERRLLRYDRSLTNREYLRAVAGNPALVAELSPIVATFDRVWYGFQRMEPDAFQEYRQQVESMQRLAVMHEPGKDGNGEPGRNQMSAPGS